MYKIPAKTLLLGKNLVFVPQCHSTNDEALKLVQDASVSEGTLVITNNQTAGRGQRGNTWETSPNKNFTFSFVLKPKILAIKDQFYLNMFTSLAVSDYIKEKTPAIVHIKWPNDIMVNNKKICGILIENQIQGNSFSNSIVGIGLNINQQNFNNPLATSLSLITGNTYDLAEELELLLQKLDMRYLQLIQNKYQLLTVDYLNAMYWRNEQRQFTSNEHQFSGVIKDIDELGRLVIETNEGKKAFGMKEVTYKA